MTTEPAGPRTLREALALRETRRWLWGSTVGLLWIAYPGYGLVAGRPGPAGLVLGFAGLAVFVLGYFAIPLVALRTGRPAPLGTRLALLGAHLAWATLLLPLVGGGVVTLWIYVCVTAALLDLPVAWMLAVLGTVLALDALIFATDAEVRDQWGAAWQMPLVTLAVTAMMWSFARMRRTIRQLRAAQAEVSRLAAAEERSRVARDVHDIVGHSLTVVAVKAELAGRLLEAGTPAAASRARSEVADLERLARTALADVRATVTRYRRVTLATELAGAGAALRAGGVQAHLPQSVDAVDADLQELFGWAVREAVTNVLRHARARNCWVTLGPRTLVVRDDGAGGPGPHGNGLHGLAERARQAGLALRAAAGPRGGFEVRLEAQPEPRPQEAPA